MEITVFGYIFFITCFFILFLPIKYLFAVVVVSCVFQSTAVINFAEKGVPPYVIGSIFLIIRSIPSLSLISDIQKERLIRYIIIFILFAACASFILSHYWTGIMVYSEGGIDSMVVTGGKPLYFGLGNIIQICYTVLNFLSLYCIYKNRTRLSENLIKRIFISSVIIVLLLGVWEFMSKMTGLIPFPYTFFYNNEGYAQLYMQNEGGLMRLNSTFLEPSYCGAFLSASFWAIMSFDNLKSKILCVFIGIALVLNLSGTGMMAFLAGIFIFLFTKGNKYIIPLLILSVLLIFIINTMGYFENIQNMLLTKMDSKSGYTRSMAAYFTWDLFIQTKGMGVGLGSHRGSSFILNILAALGIIGAILFGRFYLYLLKHARNQIWIVSFALVLLVAQCLAIPDFSFSVMWMCLFMAAALSQKKLILKNTDRI
jgi:hypothetical protein